MVVAAELGSKFVEKLATVGDMGRLAAALRRVVEPHGAEGEENTFNEALRKLVKSKKDTGARLSSAAITTSL